MTITAVMNPAAANSVQLAQLNLHLSAASPPEAAASLPDAVQLLQTAAKEQTDNAAPGFTKAFETLLLVLVNVVQHPEDTKFRTLKSSNARVQAMLSSGHCFEEVLAATGTFAGASSEHSTDSAQRSSHAIYYVEKTLGFHACATVSRLQCLKANMLNK